MYIQGRSEFVSHPDKVKILSIPAETTLEEMLPTPHMSPFTQSSVEEKMQWYSVSFKKYWKSMADNAIFRNRKRAQVVQTAVRILML